VRASPPPRARRGVAALCAVALATGCGSGDDPPAGESGPLGSGVRLQTATCRDWRAAPPEQQANTVDRLEEVASGPEGIGATLPDPLADSTLDARCKPRFAAAFLLYELYNRAAGFRSLAERAE